MGEKLGKKKFNLFNFLIYRITTVENGSSSSSSCTLKIEKETTAQEEKE